MPRKPKLGQNFLVDDLARHRIAGALGPDLTQRTVIEIGPGHGAITDILAPRCRRLICLELDRTLAAELAFRIRDPPQVHVMEADILGTDLSGFAEPGDHLDIIGNLPYYITSDILLHLFASAPRIHRAVLMMQREVADRISASPGSRDYGSLSAFTQMHAQVDNLFTLPPAAFNPPPDVYSTILRLHFAPRFAELGVEPEGFNRFLRSTFAQKRKTLANNLRVAGYGPTEIQSAWPAALAPQARSEAVSLEDMATLYLGLSGSAGASTPAS